MKTAASTLLAFLALTQLASLQVAARFCGQNDKCIEPLDDITCQQLVRNYNFQGTCCSLYDVFATDGCRIESTGTCAWSPKCGTCDDALKGQVSCNTVFESGVGGTCALGDYNPLLLPTMPPTENGTDASLSPTMAPTECPEESNDEVTMAPTPSSAPVNSAILSTLLLLSVTAAIVAVVN